MTIKDLSELADEAHELLVKDFKSANKKDPETKELLNHIKILFRDGNEDNILGDLFLDDVDCPSDFYKLLLLFAVLKK
jgi:hypothetical protein